MKTCVGPGRFPSWPVVVLALRALLAALFLAAGIANFAGLGVLVAEFEQIGFGQWLRYMTASLQIVGALLSLLPPTALVGDLILAGISLGAFLAQLLALHGDVIHTLAMIAAACSLAWIDASKLPRRWRQKPRDVPTLVREHCRMRKFVIFQILLLCLGSSSSFAASQEELNRDVVVQFYNMTFLKHEAAKAADLYLGETYTQHNPRVPNGPAAFVSFFEKFFNDNPAATSEIKRVIAEGAFVVLHSHSRITPSARGAAIVDIFRLEAGKIVEHWDVIQPVPETSANENTLF